MILMGKNINDRGTTDELVDLMTQELKALKFKGMEVSGFVEVEDCFL